MHHDLLLLFLILVKYVQLTWNKISIKKTEKIEIDAFPRSSRTEPPDLVGIMRVTDDMIDSLVCPPPPSEPPAMSEEMINELIVPAPGWSKYHVIYYSLFDFNHWQYWIHHICCLSPVQINNHKCMAVGKDVFSPEIDSSPAPSSAEPQNIQIGVKQTSRTSSFEIENLLKTAEQVN